MKQYLGVSGDGDLFEVFDVSELKEVEFLGKYIYAFCGLRPFFETWFIFLITGLLQNQDLSILCILSLNFCTFGWLLEPIKQVKLQDMIDFHFKIRNGKLFAIEDSRSK